jgi:hypothetical protein
MALDIRQGDILTVSGTDYPIRSCGDWKWSQGQLVGMRRLCSETATTKRQPAIASGKRGTPATNLTGLKCTPLDPVDPDLAQRLALNTPHELLQTYVDGGDTFYALVVEDLKR